MVTDGAFFITVSGSFLADKCFCWAGFREVITPTCHFCLCYGYGEGTHHFASNLSAVMNDVVWVSVEVKWSKAKGNVGEP